MIIRRLDKLGDHDLPIVLLIASPASKDAAAASLPQAY